jgi:hypothetical protein
MVQEAERLRFPHGVEFKAPGSRINPKPEHQAYFASFVAVSPACGITAAPDNFPKRLGPHQQSRQAVIFRLAALFLAVPLNHLT